MMPPGTNAADHEYEAPFTKAFEEIQSGISLATEKFNEIIGHLNKWAWLTSVTTALFIKQQLDTVRSALHKLFDKAAYAINHQLPVLSLISTSFRWVSDVESPMSELSSATTRPASEELAKWTGDAARSYSTKANEQKGAVDEAVDKAKFISKWLFKIARANVDYAVQLAKALTSVAGKLVQAAIGTSVPFTIPFAISALEEAVGGIVTDALNNMLATGQEFLDSVGNVRDLAAEKEDHTKLPGGMWPEAVRG